MTRRSLRFLLKLTVAAALVALLVWKVDWLASFRTLRQISLLWLVGLLFLSFLLTLVSCLKWGLFLRARGLAVSVWRLMRLYLVGYFFNNFAPSTVGGDVARGYVLGSSIGNRAESFASVFLERFTGFIALTALAILAAGVNRELVASAQMKAFMGLTGLLFVAMLLFLTSRPVQGGISRALRALPDCGPVRNLARLLDVVFCSRERPVVLAQAMALSVLFHVLTVANVFTACLALGVEADVLDLAVVVPLVLLVSSVPFSINALGIMEGAFVYLLSLAGMDPADALSVALVLRAKNILLALVGGMLLMCSGKRDGAPPSEDRSSA